MVVRTFELKHVRFGGMLGEYSLNCRKSKLFMIMVKKILIYYFAENAAMPPNLTKSV